LIFNSGKFLSKYCVALAVKAIENRFLISSGKGIEYSSTLYLFSFIITPKSITLLFLIKFKPEKYKFNDEEYQDYRQKVQKILEINGNKF